MTSRYNDISGALSKAAADLEFKDLELKSTIKQARTKSLQQAESQSQLEDQHLQLQHEFNETSARLQQQLQVAEQSAASRDSRIMALEEALTGNWFNAMRLYA
jgi:predicted  nucleic acid-binding Zn-ribbon protein